MVNMSRVCKDAIKLLKKIRDENKDIEQSYLREQIKKFFIANGISLLLALACPLSCLGQQGQTPVTPLAKCVIPFTINSTGTGAQGHFQPSTTGYDNRQTGCTNWNLVYSSTGYTVIALRLQSAPALSNVAPGTPGTYVDFAGTIVTGVNPQTATTQTPASGPIFSGYYPWIRLNASTLTGTGQITGVLIGTLPINVTGGSATGGCVGTIASPCVVAGQDDTTGLTQVLQTANGTNGLVNSPSTSGGGTIGDGRSNNVIEPTGQGGVPFYHIIYPLMFNGATWDKQFACPSSAVISTSASGATEIVPLAASQIIRICNINWVSASPISVSLVYGTGTNCGTGQANMTGIYANTTTVDFQFNGTLRTASANALCIKLGTAVATTGVVTYAQF